ncbi:MAG: hypothetical protein ABSD21_07480 [Rhizomicrobium sp.]
MFARDERREEISVTRGEHGSAIFYGRPRFSFASHALAPHFFSSLGVRHGPPKEYRLAHRPRAGILPPLKARGAGDLAKA